MLHPLDGKILCIQKKARARSLRLRVDYRSRQVIMTCPPYISDRKIRRFLEQHALWIERQARLFQRVLPLDQRNEIEIFGRPMRLIYVNAQRSHVWQEEDCLKIHAPQGQGGKVLETWLKQHAAKFFQQEAEFYAQKISKSFLDLKMKDTKSQWGSCSALGHLTFSWRLMFAPLAVAKYVAAHEVVHLEILNHSKDFWTLLQTLDPDYKTHRAWLKQHGYTLLLCSI